MTTNQNLVVKVFEGSNVFFMEDGYINATKTAKSFGKDVRDWLYSVETTKYINELANCGDFPQLVIKQRGKFGGTWIHPKLVIVFSRWLSTKFAIWCDHQIDEILANKQKSPLELLLEEKWKLEHAPVNLLSFEQISYSERLAQRSFTWNQFQEFFGMKRNTWFLRTLIGKINRQILGMSGGRFRTLVLGPRRTRIINGETVRLDIETNNIPQNLTKDFLPKPHQECIQKIMQDLYEYFLVRPNWTPNRVRQKAREFITTRKGNMEILIGRNLHELLLEGIQQINDYSRLHEISPYEVISQNLVQLNYNQLALERELRQTLKV